MFSHTFSEQHKTTTILRYTRLCTHSNVETINIGKISEGTKQILEFVRDTLIDHHVCHRHFGRSTEPAILKLSVVL